MDFGTLTLIVAAGLFGPLLSGAVRRFPMPLTIGQITAGIIIGTSGFNWLDTSDIVLQFLASMGFAMLMFLVGTKLPVKDQNVRPLFLSGVKATGITFAIATPIAVGLAYVTSLSSISLWILLLGCSSTAVIVPMLRERGLQGDLVSRITAWVIVADITSVVALPLAMYPNKLPTILLGCLAVSSMAVVSLVGLRFFRNTERGQRMRQLSKEQDWALDMRLSLFILFGLTCVAMKFGTSLLIAGFAAGTVVAVVSHPKRFMRQLTGIANGFFVPLFFVDLGAKLDFTAMFSNWHFLALTAIIVAASLAVHMTVTKICKFPWSAGFLASSQQGLPIALVSVGLSAKLLEPGQGAAVIAAMLILLGGAAIGTHMLAKLVPPAPPAPKPTHDEHNCPAHPSDDHEDDNEEDE